ncbi:ABC transporter ATP-binding protein [Pseudooceanicola sp. CBS1P-1]|uniref:ATP-binding cassette domain-containing protein n=1 Tax=Pseudooceanicola albus TaxID=2692189 RepID=A0A6L7G691_9RHOB|nr:MULTISPECIES: ABC transporter ATP-binding protein [Pseudooceanicola]MBT9386134.1 ABC transporter ATP-binding protein [Pseudooceanicola endophyticus]MXN19449.1 ATP-binding cassette domain-containing protein [Pseudooceanicola albus]
MSEQDKPFIEVSNLTIAAGGRDIVRNVSFAAKKGEVIALIGESGSGKSTIALSLMGYARRGCRITGGEIRVGDRDVLGLSRAALRGFRGKDIAYVAQSAAAAFNPVKRIRSQIVEAATLHRSMSREEAGRRQKALMKTMALPEPDSIGERYVHQVSGGQLQRMMAAMAMINTPEVMIFDEPTTALDVTTQVEVLTAFKAMIRERGVTAIYVSHDLGVVAQVADRIIVLKDGEVMENAPAEDVLERPRSGFTRSLLDASETRRLDLSEGHDRDVVLQADGVVAGYGRIRNGLPGYPVLHDISFRIRQGQTLGLIGESGSGKSTLGRVLAGLLPAAQGRAMLNGRPLDLRDARRRSKLDRRELQIVFQMADTALNPRLSNAEILGRPLTFYHGLRGGARRQRVMELLDMVRLPAHLADLSPRELSGGQKQRINLARALAANPSVVICDEVTSALDTVVANAVVELLVELQRELGLSYLFISHDLGKIEAMCNEVMVLLKGREVERAARDRLTAAPEHAYTRQLVRAVPQLRRGWLEEVTSVPAAPTA